VSAERVERRLAAILAADVAGYSRLMGLDEAGTLARLNALRRELIDPNVAEHKGRIVKTAGDGILIEVPSVVEAVACALGIGAMIALVDRALAFNPSYARGWFVSGFLRLWAGQAERAVEHAEMALRLSPRALARPTSWLVGAALFFGRHFEEAVPRLRVAIEDSPHFPTPYRFLAACYGHMGLLDEARAIIARLLAITPEVIPTYPLPFRDPQHRELYYSGLRLAMGEAE